MMIGHDLSLEFEPGIFLELNQTARNPVQPSVQAASYKRQTSAMRFVTRRSSLPRDRDPGGPFHEGRSRPMRTTFLTLQRLLRLSRSSGSPPAFRNLREDCTPASSTLDARATTLPEQQEAVLRSATVILKHWHSGKQSRAHLQRVAP